MDKTLLEQAEEARQAGKRTECLRLKALAEEQEQKAIEERRAKNLLEVQNRYPIGFYIPELQKTVKGYTSGCGTKSAWIDVVFTDGKSFRASEVDRAIIERKTSNAVTAYFRGLPFSDRRKLCIGEYTETFDKLLIYMDMTARLWTLERYDEENCDSFSSQYQYAYDTAVEEGYSDDEAEEKAQEAEDEARYEDFNKYQRKLTEAVEYLFAFVDLELIEKGHKYYITPKVSWRETADKVAELITGYGMFEYRSGKELRDSLPAKTYCEAVINHLHWLVKAPDVYGGRSYDSVIN